MKKHAFYFPVFVFIFLFWSLSLNVFGDMVDFPSVEPSGSTPATYGWAYDTRRHQFMGSCITYNPNSLYKVGSPKQNSIFKFVQSTSEIAKDSNLSINASLKILGATTYQASNKLSLISGTKSSTFNQSLYATVYHYDTPSFIDVNNISIKSDMLQLLKKPGGLGEFKRRCGDSFVIGVQEGREFLGVATVKKQTLKSWTKFANDADVSAKGAWGNVKAGVKLAKNMEQAFGLSQIEVSTYSTGSSMLNPTNIEELTDYYQKFLQTNGEKKTIKYIVAPYSILSDYPAQNPLNADTKDSYLGTLIVSLWDIKAGIEDANYVLNRKTQELFALGTVNYIKNRRIKMIRRYKAAWQNEFDKLLKATKMCNENFTKKCKTLAIYYDRYRNYIDEWDALMPEKYLSDCKTPIILPDAAFQKLKTGIEQAKQQRVHGDAEGGGGHSKTRIVVIMHVKPDGRQLKADISFARIEWKRARSKYFPIEAAKKGESAWALFTESTIFDLNNPMAYGVQLDSNLRYCTWNMATNGIKTPKVNNIPAAAPYFLRYRFSRGKSSANGYIDGMTGTSPRGQQTFANGRGTLDYIVCEADRKGKDDNLKCSKIAFKQIALNLVSTQDLQANMWHSPKNPTVPAQLMSFFANKPIRLYKRVMRTGGKPSRAAIKKEQMRLKTIRNFGIFKINLPASRIKTMKKINFNLQKK